MLIKGEGKQVVYKNRREILGVRCECCNREIFFPDIQTTRSVSPFIKYFEVTTSHQDWGNDSCDSMTNYSICQGCIVDFVTNYLTNDCDESNTASIDIETKVITKGQLEWE